MEHVPVIEHVPVMEHVPVIEHTPVIEHNWHLCKVFGDFGDAGTTIHLGTLWHQQDVGGATYFPATTSSVDLLICNQ